MQNLILLLGSPLFLRLWSVLGCEGRAVRQNTTYEQFRELGKKSFSLILYEDGLLDQLSAVERNSLCQQETPYWIPLPSMQKRS